MPNPELPLLLVVPLLLELLLTQPLPAPALCFRAPISVKETSSGEEGWDWEEGDCVWYPLEGLPGLGLALPVDPAYKMTLPPKKTGMEEKEDHY